MENNSQNDRFESDRKKLFDLCYNQKNYEECIRFANELLNKQTKDDNKRNKYYAYAMLGLSKNNMGLQFNLVIADLKKAVQYVESLQDYIYIQMGMAMSNGFRNIRKTIEQYNKCINFCKQYMDTDDFMKENYYKCNFMKAFFTSDLDSMTTYYLEYKSIKNESLNQEWYDEFYYRFAEIYISLEENEVAEFYIEKITDKKYASRLNNQIMEVKKVI